jgi:hypothetical protein
MIAEIGYGYIFLREIDSSELVINKDILIDQADTSKNQFEKKMFTYHLTCLNIFIVQYKKTTTHVCCSVVLLCKNVLI